MDHRLDWIVRKGGLAAALYFAIVGHADWLQYLVTAWVWWTLAVSLWVAPADPRSGAFAPNAIPRASAMAFDLAVLASMFLAHWYWTAFAYAAACGCIALTQARAARKL
jgi:hypothetical protein